MSIDHTDVIKVEASWGTAPWATPSWTDITTHFTEIRWENGGRRDGNAGRVSPTTATLIARNDAGYFDNDNPGSAITGNVARWTPIRIRSSDDAGATWMTQWSGFIVDLTVTSTNLEATATIRAVDPLGQIARYTLAGTDRPVELAGTRVAAVLTEIGISSDYKGTLDAGTVLLAETDLIGNALGVIQELAAIEAAYFYVGLDGKIQFRDRYTNFDTSSWNTSQVTLNADYLSYAPVPLTLGGMNPVSRVTVTPSSGSTQTFDVTAANNPPDTEDVPGRQILFDADAAALARHWQEAREYDGQRVDTAVVHVWPGNASALTAFGDSSTGASLVSPYQRVTVSYRPAGWSSDFTFTGVVESVDHQVTLGSGWQARVGLSPYSTTWVTNGANFYQLGATVGASSVAAY